jgi:hypothetical protein
LVRARTRGAALAPVVHIQSVRRVLPLTDGADRILAEIATDHVSAKPADGSAASSWDEIEAELVTGGPAVLEAIDARLRRAGARPAARYSGQGTAADQLFARGRGGARLRARPGGRDHTV